MKPYEWMVKYTPQAEWIEKRGIFLWLAFFFGGIGSGLYLTSLWLDSLAGMLTGWLIVLVLKGAAHLAFLGQPWRFWRAVLRPQTSWISRGLIAVLLFALFGLLQFIFAYSLPGSGAELVFKIISAVMAVVIAMYTGFTLACLSGVPFWNNGLLPVLFLACGITGGLGLALAMALAGIGMPLETIETGARFMLLVFPVLLLIYLWSANNAMPAGKASVKELVHGSAVPWFWGGLIVCGIVIPGIVSAYGFINGEVSHALLSISVVGEVVGGLSLRYCILKVGIYSPLIPIRS